MNTLQRGDAIPPFTTVDQDENTISLSDFTGKKASCFFTQGPIHRDVLLRPVISEIIIKHYRTRATNCLV